MAKTYFPTDWRWRLISCTRVSSSNSDCYTGQIDCLGCPHNQRYMHGPTFEDFRPDRFLFQACKPSVPMQPSISYQPWLLGLWSMDPHNSQGIGRLVPAFLTWLDQICSLFSDLVSRSSAGLRMPYACPLFWGGWILPAFLIVNIILAIVVVTVLLRVRINHICQSWHRGVRIHYIFQGDAVLQHMIQNMAWWVHMGIGWSVRPMSLVLDFRSKPEAHWFLFLYNADRFKLWAQPNDKMSVQKKKKKKKKLLYILFVTTVSDTITWQIY